MPSSKRAQQFVHRQVHQFDLIGPVEHGIGNRLANRDAGHLRDDVVEAVQVLDVQRGVDVDAGVDEFQHVLPALHVARARRVGVRQFVHQDQRGPPRQRCVQVEFLQRDAAMRHLAPRQHFEPLQQRFGFLALVRFDVPADHLDPVLLLAAGRFQHRVGLAHARRGAEKHLQPAPRPLPVFFRHAGQ